MNNPSVDKEILKNELDKYLQKMSLLKTDVIRLEGIVLYLENKIKEIVEIENSDLTNS
jgi:hypothetical protein